MQPDMVFKKKKAINRLQTLGFRLDKTLASVSPGHVAHMLGGLGYHFIPMQAAYWALRDNT